MNNLIAVIFCGGASTRMGQDKGLIKTSTGNWAQSSATLLASLNLPVFVSIHPKQQDSYSSFFAAEQLVADNMNLTIHGPMLGLLSIHEKFSANDILVLACDMRKMNQALPAELITAYQTKKGFDAYLFSQEQEPEPFLAIYCQQALASIYATTISGNLQKQSMKFMLSQLNPYYLPITEATHHCFSNINSSDDLTNP